MKTSSSSGCDRSTGANRELDGSEAGIRLRDVGLRFIMYGDRRARLKEALLGGLWKRLARMRPTEEFWALKSISLDIAHGERVGIIGQNGAGKSTLLRTVAGIYRPATGRIEVVGDIAPLIDLGAGFNHEISARENIILYGSLLGHTRREMEAKSERILEFAGVEKFANMPTKYYSRGMLLRLTFSVATDILPEILLVDEVFAGGDAEFSRKASERMTNLIDTAHILVMVSHNLNLIETLCQRVIWLHQGAIRMDGAPDEVIDAYRAFADAPKQETAERSVPTQ
jgi:ABC-type polysaccharide/polyol phosphate transport system ATPase subunit